MWLPDSYIESNYAFKGLEWDNNYQKEGDFTIYQAVKDNQEKPKFNT